jgi:polyhydroxyalkanoate synthesis regulator phasin
MSDLISRALLCGLGLASMTKDAIRKTAEDLVDQSHLSEEEGKKLIRDFHRRSTEAQKALEQKIETVVHKVLSNLNLGATHDRPRGARSAKATRRTSAGKRRRSGRTKAAPP